MNDFEINVGKIEELQTLKDLRSLENIFSRARSTIVNGEKVLLVRRSGSQPPEKFDELTTLSDLQQYRNTVFKYL